MTYEPSREERIYRNTVRALYLFALAANAVIIWGQVKDTPEGQALQQRCTAIGNAITRPYRERERFRRARNRVIFEATTVVEEAQTNNDD